MIPFFCLPAVSRWWICWARIKSRRSGSNDKSKVSVKEWAGAASTDEPREEGGLRQLTQPPLTQSLCCYAWPWLPRVCLCLLINTVQGERRGTAGCLFHPESMRFHLCQNFAHVHNFYIDWKCDKTFVFELWTVFQILRNSLTNTPAKAIVCTRSCKIKQTLKCWKLQLCAALWSPFFSVACNNVFALH